MTVYYDWDDHESNEQGRSECDPGENKHEFSSKTQAHLQMQIDVDSTITS